MEDISNDSIVTISDRCILWCTKLSTVKSWFLKKKKYWPFAHEFNRCNLRIDLRFRREQYHTLMLQCWPWTNDLKISSWQILSIERKLKPLLDLALNILIDLKLLRAIILAPGKPDSEQACQRRCGNACCGRCAHYWFHNAYVQDGIVWCKSFFLASEV